jgi:hypothetical protein
MRESGKIEKFVENWKIIIVRNGVQHQLQQTQIMIII